MEDVKLSEEEKRILRMIEGERSFQQDVAFLNPIIIEVKNENPGLQFVVAGDPDLKRFYLRVGMGTISSHEEFLGFTKDRMFAKRLLTKMIKNHLKKLAKDKYQDRTPIAPPAIPDIMDSIVAARRVSA